MHLILIEYYTTLHQRYFVQLTLSVLIAVLARRDSQTVTHRDESYGYRSSFVLIFCQVFRALQAGITTTKCVITRLMLQTKWIGVQHLKNVG